MDSKNIAGVLRNKQRWALERHLHDICACGILGLRNQAALGLLSLNTKALGLIPFFVLFAGLAVLVSYFYPEQIRPPVFAFELPSPLSSAYSLLLSASALAVALFLWARIPQGSFGRPASTRRWVINFRSRVPAFASSREPTFRWSEPAYRSR